MHNNDGVSLLTIAKLQNSQPEVKFAFNWQSNFRPVNETNKTCAERSSSRHRYLKQIHNSERKRRGQFVDMSAVISGSVEHSAKMWW